MSLTLVNLDSFLTEVGDTPEALVITPNQRIQRRLVVSLVEKALANKSSYSPPNITALSQWIDQCWDTCVLRGVPGVGGKKLISGIQEDFLWQSIISSDPDYVSLVLPSSLSVAASEAYSRILLYRADLSQATVEKIEFEHFLSWRERFIEALQANNWVTREMAVDLIIDAIRDQAIALPAEVFLLEFDDVPPQYSDLFIAMTNAGCPVREVGEHKPVSLARRVPIAERSGQYEAAARWARAVIESDPDATIGIVCPELGTQRDQVLRAFNDVFEPSAILPNNARYTQPFNISTGIPLATLPIITAAIDILTAAGGRPMSTQDASAMLRNTFLNGSISEFDGRAVLDARITSQIGSEISLGGLARRARNLSVFSGLLDKLAAEAANAPRDQRPSQWAQHFHQCLTSVGWPGERSLDSVEYQAVGLWVAMLENLSTLDGVTGHCSRDVAVGLLRKIAGETPFQAETQDSPIQILGALEAAGLRFDYLWVADFNDDIFPPAPKPNALLSIAIQKSFGMPHCSADRELEYCLRLAERFVAGADHVVFSYGLQEDDRDLRHSRLIDEVPEVSLDDVVSSDSSTPEHSLLSAVGLVEYEECDMPVSHEELLGMRGGTGLIKSQAACPFQAFAKYRLGAREIEDPVLGLSHKDRGNLLHQALEFIWTSIKTHSALTALGQGGRHTLIADACEHAFAWLGAAREDVGPRLVALETQRMTKILIEWLDMELSRPAFEVMATESTVEVDIAGLPLKVGRDRIDRVCDTGQRLVMDYKTSRSLSIGSWSGPRLPEPQVPLYAAYDPEGVSGAAFGQLAAGRVRMLGVSDDGGMAEGIIAVEKAKSSKLMPDWQDQVSDWRDSLEALAADFLSGKADVDPVAYDTCDTCHLASLCRKR
ncbi:hypothetical protein A3709_20625 [Halioglobus sp. HI00S01]|uniref:PD-(D/E)XK nuclease family protein n=1 Tax=Halioglobus sp. HI00S01 TaxID=1822214 RepID=UPI0007C3D651|nr:PD-(D/E)XK nuclease family protein [Halioglobus sp. HI00S01]KZX58019.1 hypothetical protein A3709_20625 [Halioglobus sp. HI00S01]